MVAVASPPSQGPQCGTGQASGENCIVRNVPNPAGGTAYDITLNSDGSCQAGSAIRAGSGRFVVNGVNVCERAATQAGIDWTPGRGFGSGSGETSPPTSTTPDLVVGSPTVSDSTPDTGASFTLRATVRNSGDGRSAATTLRYYRSTDATISAADTEVGTDSVSGLAVAGTSPESLSLTAPSTAGTYYYGACVDTVSGETATGNNCSTGVRVMVSSGGGGNTFSVGQTVTGIPTSGFWFPSTINTGAGASYQSQGGTVTLGWTNNSPAAGIEYAGRRYTCETSGGCEVVNGVVTRGTIRVSGG